MYPAATINDSENTHSAMRKTMGANAFNDDHTALGHVQIVACVRAVARVPCVGEFSALMLFSVAQPAPAQPTELWCGKSSDEARYILYPEVPTLSIPGRRAHPQRGWFEHGFMSEGPPRRDD